ncbi:MAG: TldD/PmbA family protein [Candidatus Zixiibacteriota bacterium]
MPDLKDIEQAGQLVASVRKSQASYADFRAVRITTEDVALADGQVDRIDRKVSFGFGVRALVDGAWGFAAAPGCDETSARTVLEEAIAIAHASALLMKEPVTLAPVKAVQADYKTLVITDPFAVELKEKVEFLRHLDSLLRETEGINQTETFLSFRREEKWFYSSAGAVITQTITHSGGGLSAAAMKSRREIGERSFPTSGGQHQTGGYEIITALNLEAGCKPTAEEAVTLLSAPVLPERTTTLLLSGDLVSLQIHESIGHPLELDRVFGSERNFSGTSFAAPGHLGTLPYAADFVTVTSDPSAPGGLGTYGYDDEGVPAAPVVLIKDGVLVDYLSSRETAARLNRQSSGAMRAESWFDLPLVRMTNINLTPGSGSLDSLIADTEDGVLIATPAAWSIDDRREKFQLGGEIAWEIKNGQRGQIYKNPVYSGTTVEFWRSCDRICGPEAYTIWGTPSCGKGQPGQNMRTGQGASPARFRNVKVGQAA